MFLCRKRAQEQLYSDLEDERRRSCRPSVYTASSRCLYPRNSSFALRNGCNNGYESLDRVRKVKIRIRFMAIINLVSVRFCKFVLNGHALTLKCNFTESERSRYRHSLANMQCCISRFTAQNYSDEMKKCEMLFLM